MPNIILVANNRCFLFFVLFCMSRALHVWAEEEIIVSDKCKQLYTHSVSERNGSNSAPSWDVTPNSDTDSTGVCFNCNSDNNMSSWFYTKFLNGQDAKLIHADIELRATICDKCKNQYLKVYVAFVDLSSIKVEANVIKKLRGLPLVKKIVPKKIGQQETHHIQFVNNLGSKGFSLVFRGEGGCFVIFKISVLSFNCEETYNKAVFLPKTNSPASGTTRVNSTCSNNTVANGQEIFGLCSSNGTWEVKSPCLCKKRFMLGKDGCKKCHQDTYKDSVGNEQCLPCPANSNSSPQALRCKCKKLHHRFQGENYTSVCHGIPSDVQNIEFPKKTDSSVLIKWSPPSTPTNHQVFIDVECFKCSGQSCKIPCETETYKPTQFNITGLNVTVGKLEPNTKYMFKISSKNINNYRINKSKWSVAEKTVDTKAASSMGTSDLPIAVIVAVPVVVVILVLIIIILIILLKRRKIGRRFTMRRKLPQGEGTSHQLDIAPHLVVLDYLGLLKCLGNYIVAMVRKDHSPTVTYRAFPLIGEKNYIDPTTYDDPERAVSEFAKELNRDQIEFISVLGGGEFGDVYKGTLSRPGEPRTKVAIKTLKPGSTHKNRKDFLLEASIMGQFKNLNVIALEGVVTKSVPLLIVTEFMENGSLDEYLKSNDGVLKPLQLLGMARGVASGMAYLAGMHFVHRDLAARNVLVNVNLACKVADFGLSRDVGENQESEYETQGGRIPVRWTAPEAIRHRKFSTASDVWSYGILLWEIMSFGERPYWEWGNLEVIERVETGYRLPPPMNCPKTVHQLMMECWAAERTQRPAFPEIVRILDEWIRNPEKLSEDHIKIKKSAPLDFTTYKSVKEWLEAFKMGMYASNFTKSGYLNLEDVAGLSENELLSKVGVRLVGHRHKIYQQIKEMNEQLKLSRDQSVRI